MLNPNLPNEKINVLVLSPQYSNIINELNKLKIQTISTVEASDLPFNERFHADMQIHNIIGEACFLRNGCSMLKSELETVSPDITILTEDKMLSEYPHNISLNGAFIGDYYICKKSHSNEELLRLYIKKGIKIINVNQGYAKCSTAIISHNAIITDDEAIYNECAKLKTIDVLKISKGSVRLDGYDYGFIGGCCMKLDKSTLAFCGDAKNHSDYDNIKAFCKNQGVELLSLSNKPLVDIGGAVAVI